MEYYIKNPAIKQVFGYIIFKILDLQDLKNLALANKYFKTHVHKFMFENYYVNDKYDSNYDIVKKLITSNNDTSKFKNITHLKFGDEFNQQVIIPNSVGYLKFGNNFNQQVTLPDSIIYLIFGYLFNQQVIIPNSVGATLTIRIW